MGVDRQLNSTAQGHSLRIGALIHYEKFGEDAMLSIPIPDHYLPFLYILGLRKHADQVTFPVRGVDGGSVSMLAVQIG
jgi:4,5-DOPA dioxygenase extradiol